MKKSSVSVAAGLVIVMASIGASGATVYENSCDSLDEWQDNSSGLMDIVSDGPSGTCVHFSALVTGSTLSWRPNFTSGDFGVDVLAGDTLCFDIKGWAQDFSLSFSDRNTWNLYWLTGPSDNPWIPLPGEWQHMEYTIPEDARVDYVCFNVYASGHEVSVDNLMITSAAVQKIPGDANNDGLVDVGDLGILAGNYGVLGGATWEMGDFNEDGAVDVGDLGILAGNYGYVPAEAAGVPEPVSMVLLGLGSLGLVRRR